MSLVYAVIPSAVVLAPLAVLAAIFPGAAAVLSVLLKRWRAFLSVVGVNSTLAAIVTFWRPGWDPVARVLLPVATALGLVWAGVRYRRAVMNDPAAAGPLSRQGLISLVVLTLFAILPVAWYGRRAVEPITGTLLVVLAAGLVAAVVYAAYRRLLPSVGSFRLSEEFVALLAMLVATVALYPKAERPSPFDPVPIIEPVDAAEGPRLADARILFRTDDMDEVMSAPVVSGKRLYFGTGKLAAFGAFGAVYAVDAGSGAVAWRFDHGGKLKPAYATPAVAGGFVYCGEGLHSDVDCRLYALTEATGELAWPVPTRSHTEGSPTAAGGRIYFGAGDDGLFCVEAGKPVWHREGFKNQLHIDSPPAVAGDRVYAGSGYRTWAVFALDAKTGDEVWRVPETLRSFGPPLILGSRVAFGLGTGSLMTDVIREPEVGEPPEREPAGAVLCVDGATGKVAWRTPVPRSVHTQMAADAYRVYAASRDGCVYALDRQTGAIRWRRPVGTGLVAGVAAASAFAGGATLAVYAVTEEGLAVCLDPRMGGVVWTKDLAALAGGRIHIVSCPTVTALDADGARRAIFYGGSVMDRRSGRIEAVLFRLEDVVPAD